MQPYPTVQNYQYQPQPVYPQPYQDRLAQLQNQYQQAMPAQQVQSPPQTNQGLLWVQGEAGAKSYLVAPNTTVLLMDSESQKFYLKSTDGAGMPSLRTFEYTELTQGVPQTTQIESEDLDKKYVTRQEYDGLQKKYDEILEKLNNFHSDNNICEPEKRATQRNSATRSKGGNNNE